MRWPKRKNRARQGHPPKPRRRPAAASHPDPPWALHGQLTNVTQSNRPFRSPYSGPESLKPNGPTEETTDLDPLCGHEIVEGRRTVGERRTRPGFRLEQHRGRRRLPQRRGLQGRRRPPLSALAAGLHAPGLSPSPAAPRDRSNPKPTSWAGRPRRTNVTLTLGQVFRGSMSSIPTPTPMTRAPTS